MLTIYSRSITRSLAAAAELSRAKPGAQGGVCSELKRDSGQVTEQCQVVAWTGHSYSRTPTDGPRHPCSKTLMLSYSEVLCGWERTCFHLPPAMQAVQHRLQPHEASGVNIHHQIWFVHESVVLWKAMRQGSLKRPRAVPGAIHRVAWVGSILQG